MSIDFTNYSDYSLDESIKTQRLTGSPTLTAALAEQERRDSIAQSNPARAGGIPPAERSASAQEETDPDEQPAAVAVEDAPPTQPETPTPDAGGPSANPHLDRAAKYLRAGLHVFPVKRGGKRPITNWAWSKNKLTEADLPKYYGAPATARNIGVALGDRSKGLIDIDLDWPCAAAFADVLFGGCPAFGRTSRPRSHRLLICRGIDKTIKFELPAAVRDNPLLPAEHSACVAEIRTTGAYTVFPPGLHESGETIYFEDGPMDTPSISADELRRHVGILAFCSVMAQMFPPVGMRHDFMMAVSGALAHAKVEADLIQRLCQTIGECNGDRGSGGRWKVDADREANRVESGQPTTGVPTVAKALGLPESCEAVFRKWLGLAVEDGRTAINWSEPDYPRILDAAEKTLVDADAGLYQMSGRLAHVHRLDVDGEDSEGVLRKAGALQVRPVEPARFLEYLDDHIRFQVQSDDGPVPIAAPDKLAKHYLARADKWRLPVLRGIIECPTLLADGTVLAEGGYHKDSGLLLDMNGVTFPPIPTEPTQEEATAALQLLKDLLSEFPFVDDASRSVALSAILTAMVRRVLAAAPVHGFDAPSIATGKSFLAEVVSLIVTGRVPAVMPQPASEEESTKVWLSVLRAGDPVVSIDNVERPVGGATMCSVVTQPYFESRLLGVSEMVRVPTNTTILCNGNNLVFNADMASRAVVARMDARVEHPDQRTFRRDLRQYIPEHRGELVVAALTALRAFIIAGRPMTVGMKPSRFGDWDRLVRGALVWLGEADPQQTREAIDTLDPARADRSALISAMFRCFGPEASVTRPTSQDIVRRAAGPDDAGQELAAALRPHVEKGFLTARGVTAALKRNVDSIVDGVCIRRDYDSHSKLTSWRVVEVREEPAQRSLL